MSNATYYAQRMIDVFNRLAWPHEGDNIHATHPRGNQTYVAEGMLLALIPDIRFLTLDTEGLHGFTLRPKPDHLHDMMLAYSPSVTGTVPLREHLASYLVYLDQVYARDGGYGAEVSPDVLPDEGPTAHQVMDRTNL